MDRDISDLDKQQVIDKLTNSKNLMFVCDGSRSVENIKQTAEIVLTINSDGIDFQFDSEIKIRAYSLKKYIDKQTKKILMIETDNFKVI